MLGRQGGCGAVGGGHTAPPRGVQLGGGAGELGVRGVWGQGRRGWVGVEVGVGACMWHGGLVRGVVVGSLVGQVVLTRGPLGVGEVELVVLVGRGIGGQRGALPWTSRGNEALDEGGGVVEVLGALLHHPLGQRRGGDHGARLLV